MSAPEREMFSRILSGGARFYAEWGTGGSTLVAVRAPIEHLIGVDSDPAWIRRLKAHPEVAAATESGRLRLLHGDLGPVGEWGSPVDEAAMRRWPRYVGCLWAALDPAEPLPDLFMVDGRFRVVCALSVALVWAASGRPEPAPRVLFHDFMDSRLDIYGRVLPFFDILERTETLVLFGPKRDLAAVPAMSTMLQAMLNKT